VTCSLEFKCLLHKSFVSSLACHNKVCHCYFVSDVVCSEITELKFLHGVCVSVSVCVSAPNARRCRTICHKARHLKHRLNAFDTFLEALLLTYVFVMHSQTAVQTCYFLTPRLHHDAGSEIAIGKQQKSPL